MVENERQHLASEGEGGGGVGGMGGMKSSRDEVLGSASSSLLRRLGIVGVANACRPHPSTRTPTRFEHSHTIYYT